MPPLALPVWRPKSVSREIEGRIDKALALKLRVVNKLSYEEIGRQFGVSAQAVHQALRKFTGILDELPICSVYEDSKAEMLSAVEMRLLGLLLDPDKLKEASLNNVAYTFQQVFNANQLKRGQATANVNHNVIIDDGHRLSDEITRLEAELSRLQNDYESR